MATEEIVIQLPLSIPTIVRVMRALEAEFGPDLQVDTDHGHGPETLVIPVEVR